MKKSTANIHLGLKQADPVYGSVNPPIYLSSTFTFPNSDVGARRFKGEEKGMIYSRLTNPTVMVLEERLAYLEEGERAIATSSGMAAIATTLLHLLNAGDQILAHRVLYGGTIELLTNILPKFGIKTTFVNFNNEKDLANKINPKFKIIYFESPTNPLMEVIDIERIVKLAKKNKVITVFDNTFSPLIQKPLSLGVDIVVHSLTKYIAGHSDVIAGAIIGKKDLVEKIYSHSYIFLGPTLSSFSAYLVLRGLTTLEVRLKKISENAVKIVNFLKNHPQIEKIYYPGLNSSKEREIVKKQMDEKIGLGGVVSFEVKGGYQKAKSVVDRAKLIHLAVSLGAVESLIEHPASMTHSELTDEQREKAGIRNGLIRLSVGLEDADDLIADLRQMLDYC